MKNLIQIPFLMLGDIWRATGIVTETAKKYRWFILAGVLGYQYVISTALFFINKAQLVILNVPSEQGIRPFMAGIIIGLAPFIIIMFLKTMEDS